jgi:hypothetical protein
MDGHPFGPATERATESRLQADSPSQPDDLHRGLPGALGVDCLAAARNGVFLETAGGWTPETSRKPPAPGGLCCLTACCDDGTATNMVNSNLLGAPRQAAPASFSRAVRPFGPRRAAPLNRPYPPKVSVQRRRRHPGCGCPVAGAGVGGFSQRSAISRLRPTSGRISRQLPRSRGKPRPRSGCPVRA